MSSRIAFAVAFLVGMAAAWRTWAGDATPPEPSSPAIETDDPDGEQTISPPASRGPIAPAIEVDHPDAERMIEWPLSKRP